MPIPVRLGGPVAPRRPRHPAANVAAAPTPPRSPRPLIGHWPRPSWTRSLGIPRSMKETTVFVQVIQGRVSDATQVRQGLDDWLARLAAGAEGWLGSTAGVTDEGTFVAVARFESAESARRNSGRAE